MSQPDLNFTITGSLPFFSGKKPAAMSCWSLGEVAPRFCFKCVSSAIHETIDVSVADSCLFPRSYIWVSNGLVGLWGASRHMPFIRLRKFQSSIHKLLRLLIINVLTFTKYFSHNYWDDHVVLFFINKVLYIIWLLRY